MDKKKKIILGVVALGVVGYLFKDKLFPASTTTAAGAKSGSPYEGMVIQEQGATGWGKVVNGEWLAYWTDTAWWNDGAVPPTILTAADFAKIPKGFQKGIDLDGNGTPVVKSY
jgi:hypothetical protein